MQQRMKGHEVYLCLNPQGTELCTQLIQLINVLGEEILEKGGVQTHTGAVLLSGNPFRWEGSISLIRSRPVAAQPPL